ncbi:hypothetical protein HK101_002643 [Irineochytrium annulatum]|nr:hypothetical protein HK101_002643 [Irineochytrium annulatum]
MSTMLSAAAKEHLLNAAAVKSERDRLRHDALEAWSDVSDMLTETLNVRVAQAFQNQKDIEAEAKRLQAASARYAVQTRSWLQLVNKLNGALKELGDAENWGAAIERDMTHITKVLIMKEQGGISGGGNGDVGAVVPRGKDPLEVQAIAKGCEEEMAPGE